jgi:serine/threonine-protein kinase
VREPELFAGRYEPLDPIGQGATGWVWRVYDHKDGKVIATKVLRRSDKTSLLQFVLEQAIRIRHPHVLSPLGWAAMDERVIITMPLADGGSMVTLGMEQGALPPLFVAEILRQLLSALEAVHAARVVHRDIAPANVLLKATGRGRPHAYLSDFGIAADFDGPELVRKLEVSGTAGFAAPEQTRGERPSPAVDMFAVGQVARQLLTGWPPTSVRALNPPEGTPEALWSLIEDLTALDPGERPTAPEASARLETPELAWREDAAGWVNIKPHLDPAPAPRLLAVIAAWPGDPPPAPRRRRLLPFLAGAMITVVALIILYGWVAT